MEDSYDFEKLRKKPKRKNSKAKGSAFERKVAKILNEHFETTDFQRSPGSGAFATTHSLPEHLKIHGDLITPQNFIYTIECKKGYNNLDIYSLLDHKSKIYEFIKQVEKDADRAKKSGIVLMAQDRRAIIALIKQDNHIVNQLKINKKRIIYILYDYVLVSLKDILCIDKSLFFN
jgi:Holliday junction resolvase